MVDMQDIVNEYFEKHPINVEKIKINYKTRDDFKILDDKTGKTFDLGVDLAQLYIKQN